MTTITTQNHDELKERLLVADLLFGIADTLGYLPQVKSLEVVDLLIGGVSETITIRPNRLSKSTKLEYLLPVLMDLAKWKEGFMATCNLRTKFEQRGVTLRGSIKTKSSTGCIDPIPILHDLIKLSAGGNRGEFVPLPPSPPPSRTISPQGSIKTPSLRESSHSPTNIFTFDTPDLTNSTESIVTSCSSSEDVLPKRIMMSVQLTTSALSLLTANGEKELNILKRGTEAKIELSFTKEEQRFRVMGYPDTCQDVIDKLHQLITDTPSVTSGQLYTFPCYITYHVKCQLEKIAEQANCTFTIFDEESYTPHLFIKAHTAGKEWDIRKCIDNFHDFAREYIAKRQSTRDLLPVTTSPLPDINKDAIRYDRTHLLQIKRSQSVAMVTSEKDSFLLQSLFGIGSQFNILS